MFDESILPFLPLAIIAIVGVLSLVAMLPWFFMYKKAGFHPAMGCHLDNLLLLEPAAAELESAAHWAMTHDVSPGLRMILKDLLRQIGHETVANRV